MEILYFFLIFPVFVGILMTLSPQSFWEWQKMRNEFRGIKNTTMTGAFVNGIRAQGVITLLFAVVVFMFVQSTTKEVNREINAFNEIIDVKFEENEIIIKNNKSLPVVINLEGCTLFSNRGTVPRSIKARIDGNSEYRVSTTQQNVINLNISGQQEITNPSLTCWSRSSIKYNGEEYILNHISF